MNMRTLPQSTHAPNWPSGASRTSWTCQLSASRQTESLLAYLDALGLVAADHRAQIDGLIHLTLTDREITILEAHGLSVTRGRPLQTRAQRSDMATSAPVTGMTDGPHTDTITSGFVTGYLDGVEVTQRVNALALAYPAWASVLSLPFPTSGYDGSLPGAAGPATVLALRITANPALRSKPGFLLIGGTHAREWMNPLIALEFAEQLLANVQPGSADPEVQAITRIVTEGDVIIVPVLNPDGLTYSIHDDPGWRKNRRPNPGAPGCPGVDDNRNYEVYFGGAGSSAAPCSEAHHGPAAFSEADTRNVRWLLEEFPNVLVGVDAHSHGRQILRPGPGGGTFIGSLPVSASDDAIYSALETTLRDAIASVNGTLYSLGSSSNHAGTSDEYMFFAHRVFGFNTECGTEFQPPWSDAVPVINEVVTGLRALALSTLDLSLSTPVPLRLVQCIDRTSSMVSFGYDNAARMNAKRFVDLMSLGDATGVVSFADPAADPIATPVEERSRQELALTVQDDPGDAATARAAIDAMVFGGWTSIGAGLHRSAGMLAGAPAPRAVLLLSDGFENRDPSVASILATWPAGLPVYTIGLGPVADADLLQHIANTTGGLFQASPGALDLHLIYNQMRADMSDADGLVFNRILPAMATTKGLSLGLEEHPIDVEPMAERLTVTLSSAQRQPPYLRLVAPTGREISSGDWGTRVLQGEGYSVYTIERPVPGRWRLVVARTALAQVMAAFVRSPLRLQIRLPADVRPGVKLSLTPLARFDNHLLPSLSLRTRWQPLPSQTMSPKQLQAIESGHKRRGTTPVLPPGPWSREALPVPSTPGRVDIDIQGVVPGGATFRRVMTRTLPTVAKTGN